MCGIYGYVHYGNRNASNEMTINYRLNSLLRGLGTASASRGTDATGIAGFRNEIGKDSIKVKKDACSAWQFEFKALTGCDVVIGHTRHATQGPAKNNWNNHPFVGKDAEGGIFAFAHNGMIDDDELRATYKLPKPAKIQTDSYAFCQALEGNNINFESLAKYSPSVNGSYVFTFLNSDGIWIVKGDNPIAIVHFKRLNLIVYASTEEILLEALSASSFTADEIFESLKNPSKNLIEIINANEGDLLHFAKDGTVNKGTFEFNSWMKYYAGSRYDWRYGNWDEDCSTGSCNTTSTTTKSAASSAKVFQVYPATTSLNALDSIVEDTISDSTEFDALCTMLDEFGYARWELQLLVMEGFSISDIEECFNTNCLAAIVAEYCHTSDESDKDTTNGEATDANEAILQELSK